MSNEESSQKKRKKGVSFAKQVLVRWIEPISNDVVSQLWYGSDDFKRIEDANKTFLKAYVKALRTTQKAAVTNLDDCLRGLECQIAERKKDISFKRKLIHSSVFTEQEVQNMIGITDPQAIAKLYGRLCRPAKESALRKAQRDEIFVQTNILPAPMTTSK